MIDSDSFFQEWGANLAAWCGSSDDAGDLARVAEQAARHEMRLISVAPDDVAALWAWLERMPIRIVARFYLAARGARDVDQISDLSTRINTAFKQGACGAQIFMRASDLTTFADEIGVVRDDLFFNKDLSIGLDIADVDAGQWGAVFDTLRRVRATSLTLVLARDTGDKSDFVGRVYALLNAWGDLPCDLHFVLGNNTIRIEQAGRLVQKIRPALACGMRMFINVGA